MNPIERTDRELLLELVRAVARVEARITRLEERLGPEPTCFTYPEAAKRLGFGLTKLKRMVKDGDIKRSYPSKGGDPMISLAEIQRVSTPEAERPRITAKQRRAAWVPIPIGKKR